MFGQPNAIDPDGERINDDEFLTIPTDPTEVARSQLLLTGVPMCRQNQSALRDQILESVLAHGHRRPAHSISRRSVMDADLI